MWISDLTLRLRNWIAEVAAADGPFANHATLTDGLVSYWALDEVSGTRYDSVVASGNDLTDNNTVGSVNEGPSGAVASFVAANSEYLSHADTASLQLASDWSASIWVNPTDRAATYELVGKDYDVSRGYAVYLDTSGRVNLQTPKTGGVLDVTFTSQETVPVGAWSHVVTTYDSATFTLRIYIDSVAAHDVVTTTTTKVGSGSAIASLAEFRIGAGAYPGFPFYSNAKLGTVGLYSKLLLDADVQALFNSGNGKAYADLTTAEKVDLVSYWNLDEVSGVRYDSHGSNDLTDNNTVLSATNAVPPPKNIAAYFTAANSEYLSRADGANTVWGEDGNGATVAGWVNLTASSGYGLVFGRAAAGTGLNIHTETGAITPLYNTSYASGTSQASIAFTAGWHFVVAWFDPATKKANISVDNSAAQLGAAAGSSSLEASSTEIRFGRWDIGTLNGSVDELGVWSRVLTAQERTDLFNAGRGLFYND